MTSTALDLAHGDESWTTAVHLVSHLEALTDLAVVHDDDGRRRAGVDLLWVESGVPWVPPATWFDAPSAAWIIDTHRRLRWRQNLAAAFGVVFVAQRRDAVAMRTAGLPARWLPLAAPDRGEHPPPPAWTDRPYDIAFVGQAPPGSFRRQLLDHLAVRVRIAPVAGFVSPNDMLALYEQARIVLNVPLAGDLNMRVFEAAAARAVLVTEEVDGLFDVLPADTCALAADRTLATWTAAVERALTDADSQARAEAAHLAVASAHTYAHRAVTILAALAEAAAGAGRPDDTQVRRSLQAAWSQWGRPDQVRALGGSTAGPAHVRAVGFAAARGLRRRSALARRFTSSWR